MAATFKTVKLYAEHKPEPAPDKHYENGLLVDELPGFVEVGVELNGVRVPLNTLKAGYVARQFKRAGATNPFEK